MPITKFQFVRYGQPAVVEVEDVLPGRKLTGTVLYDTHLANVARNSVPVKVALPDDPPDQLRPEMIASVRFQAPAGSKRPSGETVRRMAIPRRLLASTRSGQDQARGGRAAGGRASERTDGRHGGGDRRAEPTDKSTASGPEAMRPGAAGADRGETVERA